MRRSRHTDQEIAFLLREAESGTAIEAICSAAHVSVGTFYRWRRRLGGLPPAGVTRLAEIERENARLRAEIVRLRQAPPPHPISSAIPSLRLRPALDRPRPLVTGQRGGAAVGRYAFVRTAN